jgi:allantoin racemase
MRIWVQSNTALRADAVWHDYTLALEAHMDRVRRPDTEVRVEGVPSMEADIESSAFRRHVNVRQVLECGVRAEREGYDAFVMVGMGTAGYEELRDLLHIPVVYAEAVAWHAAVWQYGRFGLIGHDATVYFRRMEQIRAHGFQPYFVAGDHCEFGERKILAAFTHPVEMVRAFEASAQRAARDGADVLIPDFNVLNDLLYAAGARTFHGVPVMDTGGLALKAGEWLVDARRSGVL